MTTPTSRKIPRGAAKAPPAAAARRFCAQPVQAPRVLPPGLPAERAAAVLRACRYWVNGTQLTYYGFRRGDAVPAAWHGRPADLQAVDEAFDAWARLGLGIEFRSVAAAADAIVRIGFDAAAGSWCHVGRELLGVRDPQQRNMNFGWPLDSPFGHDSALHAVGHVLGLEHEHHHPQAGLAWNRTAVDQHFGSPPNRWSEEQIAWNVLRRLPAGHARAPAWDPDSVMHYPLAADLVDAPLKYRTGLQPRGGLSYADKAWVVETYPGVRALPVTALKPGISQLLRLRAGETRCFDFEPPRTRSYELGTFGASDGVLVLFEAAPDGPVQIAGSDEAGTGRNAHIRMRLLKGRRYRVGVRLYHADAPHETAIMVW